MTKAMAVQATGTPTEPYSRTPQASNRATPAPTKRPMFVVKAKALTRNSVLYYSGSQNEYTAKLAPPIPRKNVQTMNHIRAASPPM